MHPSKPSHAQERTGHGRASAASPMARTLRANRPEKEVRAMLWTIVLVLLVLWLLGVVALPTVGSLIHILLVLALVVLVLQLLSGRRAAL
jgi:Flp pilus assembly protein TadB